LTISDPDAQYPPTSSSGAFARGEAGMTTTQLAQAVLRLREMILRGKLPPGERVAEAPLADKLGMSRTPVRQALPLLAQEGLLIEHETRGYVVRAFTAADIIDAIDIRGALEGLAARRIAEQGASKAFIRQLKSCLEDGDAIFRKRRVDENDEALYADMNSRFHSLILQEAGSPILQAALERTSRIPFAGPQALAFDKSNLEQMYDMLSYAHRQHHAIVEALERGQSGRAEALMREHATVVKESINIAGFKVAGGDSAARIALVR
jgi:GntR family transcriptional regulator, vanillate catabolism transcriptional regulator